MARSCISKLHTPCVSVLAVSCVDAEMRAHARARRARTRTERETETVTATATETAHARTRVRTERGWPLLLRAPAAVSDHVPHASAHASDGWYAPDGGGEAKMVGLGECPLEICAHRLHGFRVIRQQLQQRIQVGGGHC